MQDHGDRPARAGRPSLISNASQAEPEGQRILSSLDGVAGRAAPAAAPARAPRASRHGWAWGGGLVVAIGAVAVAVLLLALPDGEERDAANVVRAPAPVLAKADALAPANLGAAAPAPVREDAALADVPSGTASPEAAAHATAESSPVNPLADMTPVPAPASARTRGAAPLDPLTQALEDKAVRHSHAAKPQRKAEPAKPAQAKAREKAAPQRVKREPDSDVLLLAALMSHMGPRNKKATLAEQLDTCKRYNAAGEAQCRARVCVNAGTKESACKSEQSVRKEPDS